jgi:hypothetical protein
MLQSYARFLAHAHPHADPRCGVTAVKVYRVVHGMVPPGLFAAGMDPLDPALYWPYYQGEFDSAGNLKDANDPFLYWLIPIIKYQRVPADPGSAPAAGPKGPTADHIRNYVRYHAENRLPEDVP